MCQLLFPLHLLPSRISQVSPLPVWICLLGLTAQAQSWDCPLLLLQGFVFLKFLFCALFSFGLICINYASQWGPVWCFGTYIQHTSSKPACLHPSFLPPILALWEVLCHFDFLRVYTYEREDVVLAFHSWAYFVWQHAFLFQLLCQRNLSFMVM